MCCPAALQYHSTALACPAALLLGQVAVHEDRTLGGVYEVHQLLGDVGHGVGRQLLGQGGRRGQVRQECMRCTSCSGMWVMAFPILNVPSLGLPKACAHRISQQLCVGVADCLPHSTASPLNPLLCPPISNLPFPHPQCPILKPFSSTCSPDIPAALHRSR